MKTRYALFAVLCALFALLLVTPAQAGAYVDRYNDVDVPVTGWVPNDCGGEPVYFEGVAHYSGHLVFNDNRGRITQHVNGQGVTGVGMWSGVKYNYPGSVNSTSSFNANTSTVTFNDRMAVKLIGQGPDNNQIVTMEYHVTIDLSTWTWTVLVDNARFECH